MLILLGIVVIVWLIIGLAPYFLSHYMGVLLEPGQIGDMFGAVNALFSGLAFAGLLYTIYQQRTAWHNEQETTAIARFENSFFHMIDLHHNIVEKLQITSNLGEEAGAGRQSFGILLRNIDDIYTIWFSSGAPDLDHIRRMYSDQISEKKTFHHYFRNLYHIYKLIDGASIPTSSKQSYANIITAQLSHDELACLAYNILLFPKAAAYYVRYNVFSVTEDNPMPIPDVLRTWILKGCIPDGSSTDSR